MFLVIGTQRPVGRDMSEEVSRWTYCALLEYAAFTA